MQMGTFNFSQATDPAEWRLDSGTGDRRSHQTIKFPQPFNATPQVAVALTGVDSSSTTNLRIEIETQDIEPHEFDVVVRTWADTLIFGVSGVWIAE
jgi:hypothetical protein